MKQEDIGVFIANLRKDQGWTQKEMASRLGVSDKAISKWETEKSLPDMGMLIPVSELLGISVDELLSATKGNKEVEDGNGNKPNIVIIDYATRTIERVKKSYRLIPAALLGIIILSVIVLSGLGFSFGLNTEPENPLKGIVERNPMDTVSIAVLTDEEKALTNFANGAGIRSNYLSYHLSGDKKLSSLGLYIFDGKKWSTKPIIMNSESHLGLISFTVNEGKAEVGLYEADGYASYSAERPLDGFRKSWIWGSGVLDQPINISDSGTRILTFWLAKENNLSIPAGMVGGTEAQWLSEKGSLEENAYVVALYMVVE